jgi:hypothetical protein
VNERFDSRIISRVFSCSQEGAGPIYSELAGVFLQAERKTLKRQLLRLNGTLPFGSGCRDQNFKKACQAFSSWGVSSYEIFWINLLEGFGALACTGIAVYIAADFLPPLIMENRNIFISVILILGAISVATAPAATMAITHELRAKGPLTTTLLGVVALDDALSIIIFSAAL